MNNFEKYLKYKRKYLDLKNKYLDLKGGDNYCGVVPLVENDTELIIKLIADLWYKTRDVSWSSGQIGYYLMHNDKKETEEHNIGENYLCTDVNTHIHLISAYIKGNNELELQFSQKILGHHVFISDEIINNVRGISTNMREIENYIISNIFPDYIKTSNPANSFYNNKTLTIPGGYNVDGTLNETSFKLMIAKLYYHSLIGKILSSHYAV